MRCVPFGRRFGFFSLLFTGLFAGAMKLSESREPQEQEAEESEPAAEGDAPHPEQAKGEAR